MPKRTVVKQLSQWPTLVCPPSKEPRSVPIIFLISSANSSYACVPSTASKVWYKNSPIDQEAYTHGGQSWSRVGLYHSMVRKLMMTKLKPERVI